jgi:hypothetical protein
MTTRCFLLLALTYGSCLCETFAQGPRAAFALGRMSGVFTVADFRAVNGTSLAAGWLTANVTDSTGTRELGTFTNFPVRLPVSGVLEGDPIEAGFVSEPVVLPELSTNTCLLLGVVIGPIGLTVPGLGLNLHVNQISIVVRSDRETAIGDMLCAILGADLLGSGTPIESGLATDSSAQAGSAKKDLTPEQLRNLVGILLGPGVVGAGDASPKLTDSSANTPAGKKPDPNVGLLQSVLQQAILTMQPAKAAAPTTVEPRVP